MGSFPIPEAPGSAVSRGQTSTRSRRAPTRATRRELLRQVQTTEAAEFLSAVVDALAPRLVLVLAGPFIWPFVEPLSLGGLARSAPPFTLVGWPQAGVPWICGMHPGGGAATWLAGEALRRADHHRGGEARHLGSSCAPRLKAIVTILPLVRVSGQPFACCRPTGDAPELRAGLLALASKPGNGCGLSISLVCLGARLRAGAQQEAPRVAARGLLPDVQSVAARP